MSRKNRNIKTMTATPEMTTEITDANIDALISGTLEIIEPSEPTPAVDETVLEAAVEKAEAVELYAAVEASPVVEPSAVVTPADAKLVKAKKVKTSAPRLTFAKPAAKIAHKLGEKLGDTLVLDVNDAALTAAELKVKQDKTLAEIDGLAKKVGEKAVQLMSWVNSGGSLNEIMRRAFVQLAKDGFITSGDKGTMQAALADKYTIGTARSQANQVFCLFPVLGITVKDSKGRQVVNPDSAIFAHAKSTLGL